MLYKIECDKFKKQPKVFEMGLNCILGDDKASNSIGKSTFLMLLDFAFGGNSYIEKDFNVIEEIGHHTIKFIFKFDDKPFYFMRNTETPNIVNLCNDKYEVIDNIVLDKYLIFLKEKYKLTDDVSIRNSIGRYSRIYPKDNLSEVYPLNVVTKESGKIAVLSLLKLFDSYKNISILLSDLSAIVKEKKSISDAQKFNVIPSITKKKYNDNLKDISKLQEEIEILKENIIKQSVSLEALMSSEMLALRKKKTYTLTRINYIKSKIDRIVQESLKEKDADFIDYAELIEFFPNINIEKVKEIDNFHFNIKTIVNDEIKSYKLNLENELKLLLNKLSTINLRYEEVVSVDKGTQFALETFSKINSTLNNLNFENKYYLAKETVNKKYDEKHKEYVQLQKDQLVEVEKSINTYLKNLNDYLYKSMRKQPLLTLKENSYDFNTNNDNGTGIAFKNLVILDLSILNLTILPCLIHDSVLLKQIENDAMEKIAELYESSKKQIFISFDKLSSYTKKTQEIFTRKLKLKLSAGNELFGFSWAKEDKKKAN